MTEQAIEQTNGIQLANFGGREEIRELTERIKLSLPGGMRYTDIEARTLAQISIAHDLDPFNGECWLIKDEKTGKVYGALIGIKGHRKHAKKQANYWGAGTDGGFERITDPKVLEEIKAPTGSIVYTYSIMDDVTLSGYTDSLERFTKLGFDLETAQKMVGGPPPTTVGIGIWTPGEQTKMKPVQCAMFRAEKDALKRRFDVQFSIEINGRALPVEIHADLEDEPDAEEIEADYLEVESRDEAEIIEELGFAPTEDQSKPEPAPEATNGDRPYPPAIVREGIESRSAKIRNFQPNEAQQNLLRYGLELCFIGDKEAEDKRHTVLHYLTGFESTKKVDGKDFKSIVEDWLKMQKAPDGSGDYVIDDMAALEANAIFAEALTAEGQQELDLVDHNEHRGHQP